MQDWRHGRGADACLHERRGARAHARDRRACTSGAARGRSCGTRGRPRATSCASRPCASTATPTPLLALVEPAGPACHTGERTCFHNGDMEPHAPREALAGARADDRRRARPPPTRSSYTAKLLADPAFTATKVREEAEEVARAAREESDAARARGGGRRALPPDRAAGRARPHPRRRVRGAQWASPLTLGARRLRRRSRRRARWRASTRSCPSAHTFIDDCETPVSAYLKLRGDGPSFLLESAEQGQRFGRWSFLGYPPAHRRSGSTTACSPSTARRASSTIPTRWWRRSLARYRAPAPLEGLPPFAGGAVGLFGYDLVRYAEPSIGPAEPRPGGRARPGADGPRRAAWPSTTSATRSRSWPTCSSATATTWSRLRQAAAAAIADVRERLAAPVPQRPGRERRSRPVRVQHRRPRATRPRWSRVQGVHPRGRRLPDRARASAGAPSARSTPSRSTAACARSIPARTCTSSTSATSRSPAPRRSRWSRSRAAAPPSGRSPARARARTPPTEDARARRGAAGRREGARRARDAGGPRRATTSAGCASTARSRSTS